MKNTKNRTLKEVALDLLGKWHHAEICLLFETSTNMDEDEAEHNALFIQLWNEIQNA